MQKLTWIATLCLVVIAAQTASALPGVEKQFASFVNQHGKNYAGPEFQVRMKVFAANWNAIEAHNSDPSHKYKLGVNQFSDMTYEEFAQIMLLERDEERNEETKTEEKPIQSVLRVGDDDGGLDLRQLGLVPPVEDQGSCGSCWAFSAVGAADITITKRLGLSEPIMLSNMQARDCSGGGSCGGGFKFTAADHIVKTGLVLQSLYPYSDKQGTCNQTAVNLYQKFKAGGYDAWDTANTRTNAAEKMRDAIQKSLGVMISMDVRTKFMQYSSGIYTGESSCATTATNHAMVVVGYGTSDNVKYWIVRNSWGASWGDQGYVLVLRGENVCAIEYKSGQFY